MAVYIPRYLSLQQQSIHKRPFFKRYVSYQVLIILNALPFSLQLCVKICGPSIIHTGTIEHNGVKEKPWTKQKTRGVYLLQKAILFCLGKIFLSFPIVFYSLHICISTTKHNEIKEKLLTKTRGSLWNWKVVLCITVINKPRHELHLNCLCCMMKGFEHSYISLTSIHP